MQTLNAPISGSTMASIGDDILLKISNVKLNINDSCNLIRLAI